MCVANRFAMIVLALALAVASGCGDDELTGRKYDKARACWGALQHVDGPSSGGCGDAAMMTSRDASGDYWLFSYGCIPADHEHLPEPTRSEIMVAPSCDD